VREEPLHLLDICARGGALLQQTWTSGYLPIPRYENPLFVLTSSHTFSALEELAYDLQAMGRATVVGERTRGAANPVALIQVHPQIAVRVPTQCVRNALTGANWEGSGVEPDVPSEADGALSEAHRRAAELVVQRLGPTPPDTHAALHTELMSIVQEPAG
jgi:C-terminal processing protease CtpA/Prc